ncbi:MAG: zinc-ribbon domain-containing protein [Thermoanaerobaculia bacterium]
MQCPRCHRELSDGYTACPRCGAPLGGDAPLEGQVSQIASPANTEEVEELRRRLRSESWGERMQAGSALRALGLDVDYDRRTESSPEPASPSKIDLDDFILEIRGDQLVASWDAWIGEDYISTSSESTSGIVTMPLFARYTVTVSSSALPAEVEKRFEARPGPNNERDVVLLDGLRPGKYSASFFIHVQYVDKTEGAKILNLNEASLEVEKR